MPSFHHEALDLTSEKSFVYTALSKHLFYFRMHISKFVLEQHKVPLNPFMVFEYFMSDMVNRDLIREANNNMIMRSDELWVFGEVSNGVLAEIKIAKAMNKPIHYFNIEAPHKIAPIKQSEVIMEEGMEDFIKEL